MAIQLIGAYFYCFIGYSQFGFIVEFYFYVKCFVDDIRHQLNVHMNATELKMKNCFIDIVEFHLAIFR